MRDNFLEQRCQRRSNDRIGTKLAQRRRRGDQFVDRNILQFLHQFGMTFDDHRRTAGQIKFIAEFVNVGASRFHRLNRITLGIADQAFGLTDDTSDGSRAD